MSSSNTSKSFVRVAVGVLAILGLVTVLANLFIGTGLLHACIHSDANEELYPSPSGRKILIASDIPCGGDHNRLVFEYLGGDTNSKSDALRQDGELLRYSVIWNSNTEAVVTITGIPELNYPDWQDNNSNLSEAGHSTTIDGVTIYFRYENISDTRVAR